MATDQRQPARGRLPDPLKEDNITLIAGGKRGDLSIACQRACPRGHDVNGALAPGSLVIGSAGAVSRVARAQPTQAASLGSGMDGAEAGSPETEGSHQ